jgi:hypothetical protein
MSRLSVNNVQKVPRMHKSEVILEGLYDPRGGNPTGSQGLERSYDVARMSLDAPPAAGTWHFMAQSITVRSTLKPNLESEAVFAQKKGAPD